MVFKRVDVTEDSPIEGFSYENSDGNIEQVSLQGNGNLLVDLGYQDEQDKFTVYTKDIPKLILALQAAYDHVKGKK